MCGIAGLVTSRPLAAADCLQMLSDGMRHRGPDDLGFLSWSGKSTDEVTIARDPTSGPCRVAFAHRRLAVIDPSTASWQPMSSEDGRFHLVFNGAIYNYRELRAELEPLGHVFRSQGDTEVLLKAFVQWGTAAFDRFVGMFAVAILDTARQRLVLGRDHFGIKPLYYADWKEGFAFASEQRLLWQLPGIDRHANPNRVYQYLRFGLTDHGSECMLQGIRQIEAGHYVEISLAEPSQPIQQAVCRPHSRSQPPCSYEDAAEHVRELFLENVKLHMRSDVPLGVCLSGGIDSSAIVMGMRHVAGSDLDLRTFTFAASEPEINEERLARAVGQAAGAQMTFVHAEPGQFLADMDALIESQDTPFGSTSIYAQRRVFQVAHENGVTVMLDGQGADEMLAGYRYFVAARAATLIRNGQIVAAYSLLRRAARMAPSGTTPPAWLHAMGMMLPRFVRRSAARAVGESLMPRWLNAGWFVEHGVAPAPPTQARGPDFMREQLQISIRETSLPALLRYEDRNSMAFSIESRVPFLTRKLVEFVSSLPEDYIVDRDGTSKSVFRRAMRGIVPDSILDRKDKIGFATPERAWLKELRPWMEETLHSDAAAGLPVIGLSEMQRQWQLLLEGKARFDFRFWRWANFIRWAERRHVTFE